MTNMTPAVLLNNGLQMPVIGLGVWQMENGEETINAVRWALKSGYRLIDTARLYRNEEAVGQAIRESGLDRSEIFVTTKLWPIDFVRVETAFEESLKRLGLEYVDLYLVHFPIPMLRNSVWKKMEKIYDGKRARAIGVSNYSISQIEDIMSNCSIAPAVNQVEFNPFEYKPDLLAFCQRTGIVLESYSPLTRGRKIDHPVLGEIAARYGKTAAQILIRWGLEHSTVVIPKSSRRERIEENINVFDFRISPSDMMLLDSLDK